MTNESIKENKALGWIYVDSLPDGSIVWKKKTEPGGWAYHADVGWPDYVPLIWDSTVLDTGLLEIVLKDLKPL